MEATVVQKYGEPYGKITDSNSGKIWMMYFSFTESGGNNVRISDGRSTCFARFNGDLLIWRINRACLPEAVWQVCHELAKKLALAMLEWQLSN